MSKKAYNLPNLLSFYKRGADAGIPFAMWRLGCCYQEGRFVDKDLEKAMKLFDQASSIGLAQAKRSFADKLCTPLCGKPDFEKATRLYRESADLGDTLAKFNWLGFHSFPSAGPANQLEFVGHESAHSNLKVRSEIACQSPAIPIL